MNVSDILIFGTAVAGIGLLVVGAVMAELRKAAGAGLLVGVGLGLGIFAFSAKLILIFAFLAFGDQYFARFPPRSERVASSLHTAANPAPILRATNGYEWAPLPRKPSEPVDNRSTPAKILLGERLFHDRRLSVNDRLSCASCHDISGAGGSDGRPVSLGYAGQRGTRNSPTVVNAAYQSVLFWDGRATSLEEQAKGPLINPIEMGMPNHQAVAAKVAAIPEYREAFAQVFGGREPVNIDNIAKAIAAFERTLVTPDSPYDRFVSGDPSAMTTQQVRGMALFAEFGCVLCHSGPNFSDASQLSGGMPFRAFPSVPGTEYEARYHLAEDTGVAAGVPNARGLWRIPSLRNVTRTAPYLHNGAVDDLREVVRIMARVQLGKEWSNTSRDDWRISWSPNYRMAHARPNAAISDQEIDDIVAFLHALEGDVPRPVSETLASSSIP